MNNTSAGACFKVLLIIIGVAISGTIDAQPLRGRVTNFSDNKPLSAVSISLINKKYGITSDDKGNFEIPARMLNENDTLLISSVGYQTLKISAAVARKERELRLSEAAQELAAVVIKNYTNEGAEGSQSEKIGYFRSWTTKRNGGEIGRIFYVKNDDYLVDRVRFKINSQCDTCIIRLHIRDLKNGLPDMDLLHDSVSIITTKRAFDDKYVEFDLKDKNLVLKNKRYVYVGLETLTCYNTKQDYCSMCYIGTEEGSYMYRTKDYADWEESAQHSLYLKIFYKY